MAPEFTQIESDFQQLRSFILNDVDRIVGMKKGGNYAAAAIIACALETLAQLRGAPNHATFGESLPEQWRPVAASLYDALRNGIVHGYATKTLTVNGDAIRISVSWRMKPHLSQDDSGHTVYLNAQQMAADLRTAFDRYEAELRNDGKARERFLQQRRKKREVVTRDKDELSA